MKKLTILLIAVGFITEAFGQSEKVYYLKDFKSVKQVPVGKAQVKVIDYLGDTGLYERKVFDNVSGRLVQHKFYSNNRPTGVWKYYNANNEVERERNFEKLVYGDCKLPSKYHPDSLDNVGLTFPQFGSGEAELMSYLARNIKYPVESKNNGTSGTLFISFIVDSVGTVTPKEICGEGIDGYIDLVCWEIVENMPPWHPGTKDGVPVSVQYNLPVRFRLK